MGNYRAELTGKLDYNLNYLFKNPEGKKIEQLIERLAIVDQCIDQTMQLILLDGLDEHFSWGRIH